MALLIRNIKLNKIEWASVVDRGASGDANNRPRIVLWKREEKGLARRIADALGIRKQKPANVPCDKAEATMDPTLELALDQLKLNDEQKQAVLKMLEAAKGAPAEPRKPEETPIIEGAAPMAPELKKRFEEETAKRVELEKKNQELADKIANIEFEKKASELSYLPEKTATIAQILKRASDHGDKDLPVLLEKVNKAMQESPAFREYGTAAVDGDDAGTKLENLAKKFREADPKMTRAAALVKAAKENPELYAEARKAE
jgi:hypothetical protein